MRKTAITLLALGLAAVLASPAMAASFWGETFSYANGNLAIAPSVSGGLWTSHSGTAGTDIQVTGGQAIVDMTQSYDDNRTFSAQNATAKTYACMKLRVPEPTGAVVANYFAHLKDTGTSLFAARLAVGPPTASGFKFGIGATASTFVWWGSDLNFGQTYTVGIMYDAATGMAKLWVDPASEASTSVSAGPGSLGFLISALALRQSSSGGSNWKVEVDNIQVGDSFNDLCPQPTPTVGSSWGRLKTLYR